MRGGDRLSSEIEIMDDSGVRQVVRDDYSACWTVELAMLNPSLSNGVITATKEGVINMHYGKGASTGTYDYQNNSLGVSFGRVMLPSDGGREA